MADDEAYEELGASLLAAAALGLSRSVRSAVPALPAHELLCAQCGCTLHHPTTMEGGEAVCKEGCPRKFRLAANNGGGTVPKGAALPRWAGSPAKLGFGMKPNVVLCALVARCAPAGHRASTLRHQANGAFRKKDFGAAIEAYSTAAAEAAAAGDETGRALCLCNRAAARLKNAVTTAGDEPAAATATVAAVALALEDAEEAAALCCTSRQALRALDRAWFRLGQCALAHGAATAATAEAASAAAAVFAFAVSAALVDAANARGSWTGEGAAPPPKPTQQLLDGTRALLQQLPPAEQQGVGSWLRALLSFEPASDSGTPATTTATAAAAATAACAVPAALGNDTALLEKFSAMHRVVWGDPAAVPASPPKPPAADGAASSSSRAVTLDEMLMGDAVELRRWAEQQLECALCMNLLHRPTTLPCGHTCCTPCLARALDHAFDTSPACPMCRADLGPYLAWINGAAFAAARGAERHRGLLGLLRPRPHVAGQGEGAFEHGAACIPLDRALQRVLANSAAFAAATEEREAQVARDEAAAGGGGQLTGGGANVVVPIFVCSLALPSVACGLHIFEPRYRLMMRRCLESGQRQFGMCLSGDSTYGTMLRILDFSQLPDGRSALQTLGTRRFRVLQRGQKDGYTTASVEWIDDAEDDDDAVAAAAGEGDGESSAAGDVLPEARQLSAIVDALLRRVGAHTPLADIERQLGPRPPCDGRDGKATPAFVFWCMALGNMDHEQQLEICFGDEGRHSPAVRLRAVAQYFGQRFAAAQASAGGDQGSDDGGAEEGEDSDEMEFRD